MKRRFGKNGYKKNGLPICGRCRTRKAVREARDHGPVFFLEYIKEVAAKNGRLPVIKEVIRRIERIVRDGKLKVH